MLHRPLGAFDPLVSAMDVGAICLVAPIVAIDVAVAKPVVGNASVARRAQALLFAACTVASGIKI